MTGDRLDQPDEAWHPWTARTPIISPDPAGTVVTPTSLRALPVAFPFDPVVPQAFGISRSAAYRALAAGELPVRPLRLGRRLIVRRADLLAALGIDDVEPVPGEWVGNSAASRPGPTATDCRTGCRCGPEAEDA